jgi:uncharacterized RDD family membrane protein YckC
LSVAYDTLLVGAIATTIGKRALGLRVIMADGSRVSYKRSLVRAVVKTVSLQFLPGWLTAAIIVANIAMVLVRPDRRSIHDMIAGTAVVRR